MEVEKLKRIGPFDPGMPTAIGLGVKRGVFPPKAATVATEGYELMMERIQLFWVALGR